MMIDQFNTIINDISNDESNGLLYTYTQKQLSNVRDVLYKIDSQFHLKIQNTELKNKK